MQIIAGSLEVVEGCNGYYLYGRSPDGEDTFIACLGDGVDDEYGNRYDPNRDPWLADVYGITLVEGDQ